MAYTVNKTNSSASPNLYTVQDGVVNTQTDLSFIGKGYAGYGESIAENFLHLLENFSNTSAPTKPIEGQLWWDSTNSKLKVYTGSVFQSAGGSAPYQSAQPSGITQGDLWIDSDTGLKVNRGETSVATEQDLFWVWDETFADDGTTIFGNAGGAWTAFKSGGGDNELSAATLVDIRANIVHATSTSAQYADLAERYATDVAVEIGDVVILGGSEEITKCMDDKSDAVFGVISESPAFLMNSQAGNNDTHPMVALKGRVLVKVTGNGSAGDRVVSAGNGAARVAAEGEATAFNTLGRLIKHKYKEETALTECVIGVK